METAENPIVEQWNALRVTFDELSEDVVKNARGVAAAGVRARRGLRAMKKKVDGLVKLMLTLDKAKKAKDTGTDADADATEATPAA